MVQGRLGSYRTGREANDNINTKKKRMYTESEEQNRSCSTVFLLFKPRYNLPQRTSTRALLFLVSVSLSVTIDQAPKKVRFMSILTNGWFSGSRLRGENSEQTSLSNQVMGAKYLRRYSRCKHRIEKYLCSIYRLKAEIMNHSIRVVHTSCTSSYFYSGGSRPFATVDTSLLLFIISLC